MKNSNQLRITIDKNDKFKDYSKYDNLLCDKIRKLLNEGKTISEQIWFSDCYIIPDSDKILVKKHANIIIYTFDTEKDKIIFNSPFRRFFCKYFNIKIVINLKITK